MKRTLVHILGRLGRRRRLVARLAPYRLGPMGAHAAAAYVKDVARGGRLTA